MPPLRGSATYKKKDGTLAMSKDSKSMSWTPLAPRGAPPALTINIASITNLQALPPTNPKAMLKIFAQPPEATEPEVHTFTFTSPTAAKLEGEAIKQALSDAINKFKSGSVKPAPAGGSSAALAIASAISSAPTNAFFDDKQLKSDIRLQQSLLDADPSLSRTFMEADATKPESITKSQFAAQFWSTRLHLLRAHAIEKDQKQGAYNVLSTVKPKIVDSQLKVSLFPEQIRLIFNQHPLVKRVYDENVPRLTEERFWSRFFQSRLFKKLKGEKIMEADEMDPILDNYLNIDEDADRAKRLLGSHIPHIIDVEGNEQNHSQRKGNQPDWTMKPSSSDKVPIIRTLNTLSEKIMAQVAPNDVDPSAPIGLDEETFNQLALHDLQGDAEENRIMLNIRDQKRFFSDDRDDADVSTDAKLYATQIPSDVLADLHMDLDPELMDTDSTGGLNLEKAIGVNDESDFADDEDFTTTNTHRKVNVGSKKALSSATTQILSAIQQRRSQTDDLSLLSSTSNSNFQSTNNDQVSTSQCLSDQVFETLTLTHATTTEFLNQFWRAFLSGDPSLAISLQSMVESLNRAMDRMKAVGDKAEEERNLKIREQKELIKEYERKTGKRVRGEMGEVVGGRSVVEGMLRGCVKAVEMAVAEYQKAWREQGGDLGRDGGVVAAAARAG
ncbi:MAG: RNA polymerase II transcription factor B subunit 1 [Candelina mexicana]|nr:MAG: RNA polymerase II transcription factor B subunit 1 [Candelina mexicana]